MSITRAPRPQSNFYLLDKKISEDKRLSWAARGMLVFLLGKPDHWTVSTQNLINETAESGCHLKRDGVRGVLQELIQAGYLRRVLARGEAGKLGGYDYEVSEVCIEPSAEAPEPAQEPQPETEKPAPAKPATAEPAPANPPLVSTDQKQGLNGKQGLKRASAPMPCPEGVAEQTWSDFVQLRKDLKASITQTGLDGIAREASKAGWTLEAALAECCTRGWRGFRAEWVCDTKPAAGGRTRPGAANAAPAGSDDEINQAAMRKYGIGGDFIDMED